MWHCTECNQLFKYPKTYYEDPSPPGIALPPGYYTYVMCPYCESEYIEEVSDDKDDWEDDWDEEDIWDEN